MNHVQVKDFLVENTLETERNRLPVKDPVELIEERLMPKTEMGSPQRPRLVYTGFGQQSSGNLDKVSSKSVSKRNDDFETSSSNESDDSVRSLVEKTG
jgi:hypothetical protein